MRCVKVLKIFIVIWDLNRLNGDSLQVYAYVVNKFVNLATKFIYDRYPYNSQSYQTADGHAEDYATAELHYRHIVRH